MSFIPFSITRAYLIAFTFITWFVSTYLSAQEFDINLAEIEKLNVTAQKREQNIQHVPHVSLQGEW